MRGQILSQSTKVNGVITVTGQELPVGVLKGDTMSSRDAEGLFIKDHGYPWGDLYVKQVSRGRFISLYTCDLSVCRHTGLSSLQISACSITLGQPKRLDMGWRMADLDSNSISKWLAT